MLIILIGRIYEEGRCDGHRYRDMHTKFHKDRFRYSKVARGIILFFLNKESKLINLN
jgi:hypothetical protein